MGLFDFLKRKRDGKSNLLIPKICPTEIPINIATKIDEINWIEFQTAYGNAEKTIPFYLKNLFCKDTKIAMDACHQLWCSLCHQHAFISTAALPSYDILKMGLLELENKLKVELLDIFQGFAYCSTSNFNSNKKEDWEMELRSKLLDDIFLFKELVNHPDENISNFASDIVDNLVNDK